MTMALCLNCGNIKFGALCPCSRCQFGSTGNIQLDIAFSDHHLRVDTLEQLGRVVETLRAACDDDAVRSWAFIRYVSDHHPSILTADPPEEFAAGVADLLNRVDLPPVTVVPAHHSREPNTREPPADARRRPWWKFW